MARQESDREDLLREATALVERVELSLVDAPEDVHVTAGFRHDGAASIFFGAEPVFQFNAAGELRRAYCNGLLFKAVRGRLASLRRVRQHGEVQLLRHDLTDAEQTSVLTRMQEMLVELANQLSHGRYNVVGQVPAGTDVVGRLKLWLARQSAPKIANSPHAEQRKRSSGG
ncbi:MAG: hypothetical protein L0228_04920 [Planctomycetes bacterium]|nr:hypothetical protein [Planctomycetota bacterium]